MRKIWHNTNKKAFWTTLIISIGLLVASFLVPPLGEISPSVLKGVAELGFFATLSVVLTAVEKGSDVKVTKGDITLEVDNPDQLQQ